MDITRTELLIQQLENVSQRPSQYFADELLGVTNFLSGFKTACSVFGVHIQSDQLYQEVVRSHGWEWTSMGPLPDMKTRGLSDDEIARELLSLEIETWKKRLAFLKPESDVP